MRRLTAPAVALIAYVGLIYLANWMIANLPPVAVWLWPVILAPAGVLPAGLVLAARDYLSERGGRGWVAAGIAAGAALSASLSGPLALASGVAFALSELADWAAYEPLRRRGLVVAVVASNAVGLVVDSALFLGLAGLPWALLPGLIIGKVWATALAVGAIYARRATLPRPSVA